MRIRNTVFYMRNVQGAMILPDDTSKGIWEIIVLMYLLIRISLYSFI